MSCPSLRLSGKETYKKWSGGFFYVLDDNSLIPAESFGEIPKGKEVKGLFIAGVQKENMPFVEYTIFNKDNTVDFVGHYIKEENNGVRIILAKNFGDKNHRFFNTEIKAPYPLDKKIWQFYTLHT